MSSNGEPGGLNLEPIINELRELYNILYIPSNVTISISARK